MFDFQFVSLPNDYDETYFEYARRGARVLALGRRELGTLTAAQVRSPSFSNLW
jgi:cation-transporting ATPase 13A1